MTKKTLSFISIFKTNFIANETVAFVSHPVRVSVFKGTKTYKIPKQTAYRFPKNKEKTDEVDAVIIEKPDEERQYEYAESDTFARLEYIVREIMRYMCGLPYSGSLDRYL